ncbi:MAG: inositol monophosphatase, partial [Planctomycetes bacterium]|nr:inositol monophosphatase [Planctomycetota bacterium]
VGGGADSDVKFDIDLAAEEHVIEFCRTWAEEDGACFVLIAEGVSRTPGGPERVVFPESADECQAQFVLILDPIDGTRELMYDKRSGWALSGISPYSPVGNTLADIEIAVQTELPTAKQTLADTLIATTQTAAICERADINTGEVVARFRPRPSSARDLEQGFVTVSKFFPGGKELASRIEEKLALRLAGPIRKGRAAIFDDEYVSSGGQLYELIAGHDRFIADIRPLTAHWLAARGMELGLCAHPYDLCTELIARQAGVRITTPDGAPLSAPLDTVTDVAWVGYANEELRKVIEPHFQQILAEVLTHST